MGGWLKAISGRRVSWGGSGWSCAHEAQAPGLEWGTAGRGPDGQVPASLLWAPSPLSQPEGGSEDWLGVHKRPPRERGHPGDHGLRGIATALPPAGCGGGAGRVLTPCRSNLCFL